MSSVMLFSCFNRVHNAYWTIEQSVSVILHEIHEEIQRRDGSAASMVYRSRRPHTHPNRHTDAELKLIRDMRRRNHTPGIVELRHRLRQRGFIRCPESLFRVMRKVGLFPKEKSKLYRQAPRHREHVRVDIKAVPHSRIADHKRFYSCHAFYSPNDFAKQLTVHNRCSNNLPIRPLYRLSPNEFAV